MEEPKSPELALAAKLREIGISKSYASQIANGRRPPSVPLALDIHEKLELKLGPLAGLQDDEIALLARMHERAA